LKRVKNTNTNSNKPTEEYNIRVTWRI